MELNKSESLVKYDKNLAKWTSQLHSRWTRFKDTLRQLERDFGSLKEATELRQRGIWINDDLSTIYTEYAPGASSVSLVGEFNQFDTAQNPLYPVRGAQIGLWRCTVPPLVTGETAIPDGTEVAVAIVPVLASSSSPESLKRIPAQIYSATQTLGEEHYRGRMSRPPRDFPRAGLEGDLAGEEVSRPPRPLKRKSERIYEAHIGASSGAPGVMGTFKSFKQDMLPRIKRAGYTTVQLMGVAEHPYYPSFGYQISNFFAPSSRFGSITDLIDMIDEAHRLGLRVLMDLVHAHSCTNEGEGLNMFDGSQNAGYFKDHLHPEWKTRLFDYSQPEVLRFLLSNLRFWTMRVGFDGFRFDAVSAMLYKDHGLFRSFSGDYEEYFGSTVDEDAVTYLMLAHHLLEELAPGHLTTIAEDVSGFPTLCLPITEGGIGFDYRLGLGIPDMWFELLSSEQDFDIQPLGFIARILSSLNGRRATLGEKTIAYVESHDQCIVGGSSAAQYLFAGEMYSCMSKFQEATLRVEMAMGWHKLLRMLTHTLGGEGYLNFMGNEFGHPEWFDLPGPHNHYSQDHAYRKWNLGDDDSLRFSQLSGFDQALNTREEAHPWLSAAPVKFLLHDEAKRFLAYTRGGLLFLFNLTASDDWTNAIPAPSVGIWENVLDSDEGWYGGTGRASRSASATVSLTSAQKQETLLNDMLVPPRTGVILKLKE